MQHSYFYYSSTTLPRNEEPSNIVSIIEDFNKSNRLIKLINELHSANDRLIHYKEINSVDEEFTVLLSRVNELRREARLLNKESYNLSNYTYLESKPHFRLVLDEEQPVQEDDTSMLIRYLNQLTEELHRTNSIYSLYPRRGEHW